MTYSSAALIVGNNIYRKIILYKRCIIEPITTFSLLLQFIRKLASRVYIK